MLKDSDILDAIKAFDEAKPPKNRKMMVNKRLQKSLSDVIGMIEMLGENRLEVWYGDTKVTLKMSKITLKDCEGKNNE